MRHAAVGVTAALEAPLALRGRRLGELLEPPAATLVGYPAEPADALRWARFTLRCLARVPGSPWRNTCLYRSAAECLVLRRRGIPAVLRIGVRTEEDREGIAAHAWVERLGTPEAPEVAAYVTIRPRPGRQA